MNTKIRLDEVHHVYVQDGDGCDPIHDNVQELRISTQDAGGGMYYVIETKRWAFDDIDEMIDILTKFKNTI